ncbi:MAG: hypothetical protein V1754_05320, partial [Pseudomonadota bacterium]
MIYHISGLTLCVVKKLRSPVGNILDLVVVIPCLTLRDPHKICELKNNGKLGNQEQRAENL